MGSTYRFRYTIWQRACAVVLALASPVAGVLLTLHHHESEVGVEARDRDSGLTAATHFEKLHHEPCGLCANTLGSARLERPSAALVDELVDEHVFEGPRMPPGPPGRHGASRAPPVA